MVLYFDIMFFLRKFMYLCLFLTSAQQKTGQDSIEVLKGSMFALKQHDINDLANKSYLGVKAAGEMSLN